MVDYTKRPSTPAAHTGGGAGGGLPSKVTLTKAAPAVSLRKQGATMSGELRVNLNWNPRPAGAPATGGFLKRLTAAVQTTAIDLDLCCLYELSDGTKGVVQALGNAFRSTNRGAPIITLDGDDRSGNNTAGENLRIDLSRLAEIRRVLVFAFIYEGTPNWAGADGVVTLHPHGGAPIEVRLDEADPNARTCAIAMLENTGNDLAVRREVRYINGSQSELDRTYGWGMRWTPGRKE
jgi:tellurite resistance protein TerA